MSLLDCICCFEHELRTALTWDTYTDGPVCSLTYSELISNAHTISSYLQQNVLQYSVESGAGLICVYGCIGPEVLSALLGIMALPSSFMPMDLALPSALKEQLLRKYGVQLVLVHLSYIQDFLTQAEAWSATDFSLDSGLVKNGFILCSISWTQLNSPQKVPYFKSDKTHNEHTLLQMYYQDIKIDCRLCDHNESVCNLETRGQNNDNGWEFPKVLPTEIAYLLHTSGTTGLSKPVCVPHCCIVPNIIDLRERFQMQCDDVIFNAAPLTFDPAIVEIFLALSSGATLLMVPDKIKASPIDLATVLFKRQYTSVLQITPTLMNRFSDDQIKSDILGPESHVRVLAFGGENCPSFGTIAKWKSPENRTSLFNIYGITEVSSWATCYQITSSDIDGLSSDDHSIHPVPLGEPLLGTKVRVQNEMRNEGVGPILIGGDYRACILEGEIQITPGIMRHSGDYAYFDKAGKMFYQGRCDRRIKRLGHRINLDSTEKVIGTLDGVAICVVTTSSLEHPSSQATDESILSQSNGSCSLVAFVVPASQLNITSVTLKLMLSQMRTVLPTYSIPDEIKLVKYLPMTDHGKVDLKALLDGNIPDLFLYPRNQTESLNQQTLTSIITSATTVVLGLQDWSSNQRLIDMGANSFDIVRIANLIESEIQILFSSQTDDLKLPKLVEYLLTESFDSVLTYLQCQMKQFIGAVCKLESGVMIDVKKQLADENFTPPPKRMHLESFDTRSWRRGQFFYNGLLEMNFLTLSCATSPTPSCSFKVKWKVDTGKCVDASPLVVQYMCSNGSIAEQQSAVVFIGSHSGWFFSIEFSSGTVLWKTLLNDRIESSACVSVCGRYVVVGTYSGSLYTLDASTGAIYWCLEDLSLPCEPIKSSPVADPITGLVWFGSHNQHLYGVNILVLYGNMIHLLHKQLVFERKTVIFFMPVSITIILGQSQMFMCSIKEGITPDEDCISFLVEVACDCIETGLIVE